MRNFTLKPLLFCTALAGMAWQNTIQAQDISFRIAEDEEANRFGINMEQSVPIAADFNNDGRMDIFASGQTYEWFADRMNADGTFGQWGWYDDTRLSFNNGDGTWTVYNRDSDTGLPIAYGGIGSKAFDFNQDGFVDFVYESTGKGWTGLSRTALLLVINNGDGTFTVRDDPAFALVNPGVSDQSQWNQNMQQHNMSIADYNKDGYPDLLIQYENQAPWERAVKLFKNIEGDHFEMVTDTTFIPEIKAPFIPSCAGQVSFGDFNNDGWPDIVTYGWVDDHKGLGLTGGGEIHFYRNKKDGTFELATTDLDEDINTAAKRWTNNGGSYGEELNMFVVDYDQDGKQDVLILGETGFEGSNAWSAFGKEALLLKNISTGEKFAFEEFETALYPGSATKNMSELLDFNGDGWLDFISWGWNGDWHLAATSSSASFDSYYANENLEGIALSGGYMAHADLNDDGMIDLMTMNSSNHLGWSINTTEPDDGLQVPEMPQGLQAEYDPETRQIKVVWEESYTESDSKALYNLYLKNKFTGKTFMIAPADIETGVQRAYTDWSGYIPTASYTFEGVEKGNWTVGVQSVAYSWQASPFSTTDITLNTGLQKPAIVVTSASPSEKQDIATLSTLYLTFSDTIYLNAEKDAPQITLADASGNLAISIKKIDGQPNTLRIVLPETVEAGAYTLTVPERAVCRNNGDWNYAFTQTIHTTGLFSYVPTGININEGNQSSLSAFTLTFPDLTTAIVNPDSTIQAYLLHHKDGTRTRMKLSQTGRGNQIKAIVDSLPAQVNTEGLYTLVFPTQVIQRATISETDNENGKRGKDTTILLNSPELRYNYSIGYDFTPNRITPSTGKLFSLQDFTIEYAEGTTPEINPEATQQAYLLNKLDGNQTKATLSIGEKGNEVWVRLAEEVTAEGSYSLIVPAQTLMETTVSEDGTASTTNVEYAPQLTYNYTISYDYIPTTITPATGLATSLQEFTLQFAKDTHASLDEESKESTYLINRENGKTVKATLSIGEEANRINIMLTESVSDYGSYSLIVPAKAIRQISDMPESKILDYAPELTYNFIIMNPSSIGTARFSEPSTLNVYDLNGILIRKDAKREDLDTLKKGIYIINGKKAIIK